MAENNSSYSRLIKAEINLNNLICQLESVQDRPNYKKLLDIIVEYRDCAVAFAKDVNHAAEVFKKGFQSSNDSIRKNSYVSPNYRYPC